MLPQVTWSKLPAPHPRVTIKGVPRYRTDTMRMTQNHISKVLGLSGCQYA